MTAERAGDLVQRVVHLASVQPAPVEPVGHVEDPEVTEWRERRNREHAAQLFAEQIPRRLHRASLDGVDPEIRPLIEAWTENPARNLVVTGPVGVGKTWAAVAAVRPLIDRGFTFRFWSVVELLDQMRPGGDDDVWARAADADVVILDDVGTERSTEWTAERLYSLINRRWLDERPIVATTNLPAKDLKDVIGERAYSRLIHGAVVLRMTGPDRRKPQPKETP